MQGTGSEALCLMVDNCTCWKRATMAHSQFDQFLQEATYSDREPGKHLDRDTVVAALASISPVQREAIELAYFGGLTQTEIAERTGVPLGTVKGRLRLGLQGLRAALMPVGGEGWTRG